MDVLNPNHVRQRPYLGRKAKLSHAAKFGAMQPQPVKKTSKRSALDDVTNNETKRKKKNMRSTVPSGHRIMTRARSQQMVVAIFDDQAQAEESDAAEAERGGADTKTETTKVTENPGRETIIIPQGVQAYDDGAPVLTDGYSHEIHEFYFKRECEFQPSIEEIKAVQTEITAKMRSILLDWLVEVAQEFHLNDDTLFLCTNLIDRSMSVMMVRKSRLQLLGCACLLIASKYEEIHPPSVEELAYISDNTYRCEQIRKMEAQVLGTLSFQLSVPTVRTFLSRFVRCASSTKMERMLCAYLAELCMLDINWLGRKPSLVAASVLYLARKTLKALDDPTPVWDETLEYYTHYNKEQIEASAKDVHTQHVAMYATNKLVAIKDKYSSKKKLCVTQVLPLRDFDKV